MDGTILCERLLESVCDKPVLTSSCLAHRIPQNRFQIVTLETAAIGATVGAKAFSFFTFEGSPAETPH